VAMWMKKARRELAAWRGWGLAPVLASDLGFDRGTVCSGEEVVWRKIEYR
jgi:hypothetical protein